MSLSCKSVAWSDSYLIGDQIIDKEHKKLFILAEELFNSKEEEAVLSTLKELIKYTKFHFTHEEQFMQTINFKYLKEHKQIHKDIVTKLQEHIELKNSMKPHLFAQKLALFVKDNIIEHILIEDKKFQHFKLETPELKNIFQWKDKYKIDHKQIDSDNQKIFNLVHKALDMPKENKKENIKEIVFELYSYMQEHFKNEEAYLQYINFPDFENHKKQHENIIDEANTFIKSIPKLSIEQFERNLIEYIDIWVINHIITEDHKIACFTNAQKK